MVGEFAGSVEITLKAVVPPKRDDSARLRM
jgi:hypothetical protein